MRNFTISLFFLVTLVAATLAQNTQNTLKGVVTTPDGTPLPGVCCLYLSRNDVRQYGPASTDDAGMYSFTNLTPGPYILEARIPGFAKFNTGTVRILATQPFHPDFLFSVRLRPETNDAIIVERNKVVAEPPNDIATGLEGIVMAPDGTPVPNLCCFYLICDGCSEPIGPITTSSDGSYSRPHIYEGRYTLQIRTLNFATIDTQVHVEKSIYVNSSRPYNTTYNIHLTLKTDENDYVVKERYKRTKKSKNKK